MQHRERGIVRSSLDKYNILKFILIFCSRIVLIFVVGVFFSSCATPVKSEEHSTILQKPLHDAYKITLDVLVLHNLQIEKKGEFNIEGFLPASDPGYWKRGGHVSVWFEQLDEKNTKIYLDTAARGNLGLFSGDIASRLLDLIRVTSEKYHQNRITALDQHIKQNFKDFSVPKAYEIEERAKFWKNEKTFPNVTFDEVWNYVILILNQKGNIIHKSKDEGIIIAISDLPCAFFIKRAESVTVYLDWMDHLYNYTMPDKPEITHIVKIDNNKRKKISQDFFDQLSAIISTNNKQLFFFQERIHNPKEGDLYEELSS